jgi:diaminohydroxyphosphoribosylaminopyrimidine deaminase/5-amino-6-(5-phosphoribosylamino)uracil reductase
VKLPAKIPSYSGKQPLPLVVASKNGKKVNLKKLLRDLGAAGFQSIFVEGGGILHTELLKNKLVDYIVVVIAPKLLGKDAKPWIHNLGNISAKRPFQFSLERTFQLGDNIIMEGRPLN